jgi:hypothetical protein
MQKYRIILVLLFLGCLLRVSAQVDLSLDNLRTVAPPSPNASSLGKFGEWPVGLYTGLPSINLPIYELKGRGLSVPIGLSYHPAGIRVGEIASWVGLGWALNAGGCISRTVQGLPDDDSYYTTAQNFTVPGNLCSAPVSDNAYLQTIGALAQGNLDGEQDIYNLNVLGKSYRIYLNGDTAAYTMPASNVKIVSNYLTNDSNSWTVILEDGTRLLFGGPSYGANSYIEYTNSVRFGGGSSSSYTSSWYLRSMTSPNGETFNFTYTGNSINQDTHFSQSDWIEYYSQVMIGGSNAIAPFVRSTVVGNYGETATLGQLSLSTIESDLARVYFIPSSTTRADLNGAVALSEIKVLSKLTNTYVEDWIFNYAYSQAAGGNEFATTAADTSYYHHRLKLMSLTRKATDNSASETWSLTYNPMSLPSRMSFAQDYWGFYNGATSNNSLLPSEAFNPLVCTLAGAYGLYAWTGMGFMDDIGENRLPNPQYMQAEMLQSITYPTGGKTVFNFEPNSMPSTQELLMPRAISCGLNYNYADENIVDTFSYPFYLSHPQYISYTLNSSIAANIIHDYPGAKLYAQVLDSAGNTVTTITTSGSSWFNIYQAGHYRFKIYTNINANQYEGDSDQVWAVCNFYYDSTEGVQSINKLLGGLRINNIQDYDGVSPNPVNSKYYVYDSAFVINPVDSINDFLTFQNVVGSVNLDGSQYEYVKITRNSSTKYSLGSIQGGTVGYGKVTTYYGAGGANGYTVSSFSCDPTTLSTLTASKTFPYPPIDQYEWRNGLLLSEITYNAQGQRVKASQNSYNFLRTDRIEGLKVGYSTTGWTTCAVGASYGACGTDPICYSNTNEQVMQTSHTDISYDMETGTPMATTRQSYYDNAADMQPTRITTTDSKGRSLVYYNRRALEMADINNSIPLGTAATAALDTMIARNMVSESVEAENYVNGNVMEKQLINYSVLPSNLVLPANVMLQVAGNPIETRLQYENYDNYGNLVTQSKATDVLHTYIYDYANTYPIAEVINADGTGAAYTSFEADGKGGWTTGGTGPLAGGITGNLHYSLNSDISRSGLSVSVTYVVSYWSSNGAYSIPGTISGYPITGKTVTLSGVSWTYYEHHVTGQSVIQINGTGSIDELRLYPSGAQMNTYTYAPLIGMSSQCDVASRVTYYFYDGLRRLSYVKDQDGNIVKTYHYHYKGQ